MESEQKHCPKFPFLASLLSVELTLGLPSASWSDWKDPALLWLCCSSSCGGFKVGRFSPLWEEVGVRAM